MVYEARELSVYAIPGRVSDPRPGIGQAVSAERTGFGSVWIAERWDFKEIGAVCGAIGQATKRIQIVAGMTHFGTRHPLVLAGMGATLQALTDGRFRLGIARSSPQQWNNLGLPVPNNAALADHASLLRRLWAGETLEHTGPAGRFPQLRLGDPLPVPPPLLLAAIGPKMLELAGAHFDGVVLHPFLTVDAVRRSARIARDAAQRAGRDAGRFRVVSTVVVAPDLSAEDRLTTVEARAVTYFSIADVGGALLRVNGWDPGAMQELLGDPSLRGLEFQRVPQAEFQTRIRIAAARIPAGLLEEAVAAGDARACAARLRAYRDAGADELLLHGATAERLGATVENYAA